MPKIKKVMAVSVFLFLTAGLGLTAFQTWNRAQVSQRLVARVKPFQRILPEAPEQVLVAGDSTALGVGSLDPNQTIAGRLGQRFPNAAIVNISQSGLRTRGLVPKLSELTAGAYDPVILQVGGNDILYFTPLDELSQDITLVLEQARRLTDGQIILLHSGNIGLAPFFPRWAGWLWSGRTKAVREVFSKAARANGASYVDLYHNRADDPFLGDIQRFYSADYLHPTGAGYGVWYTEVEKYL